ncbi:MAG TPA: hypothetical protein V6D26_24085, partial [Stenomitos sp.]
PTQETQISEMEMITDSQEEEEIADSESVTSATGRPTGQLSEDRKRELRDLFDKNNTPPNKRTNRTSKPTLPVTSKTRQNKQ